MGNRFKFRAVLKTDTHSIIAEPYYIFDNGYFVNIDDVQKPFEKKYPDDCFWEFIEEIEKQDGTIKVFPIENIESIELQIEVKDE